MKVRSANDLDFHAQPKLASGIAFVLLVVSAALAPLAGAKSGEVVRAASGVTYVTGGIGSEAVDLLKSMEKEFNLKLVFATTAVAYVSDVKVRIVNAGGDAVLDAMSEGPLLMANLPAGVYQVNATLGGHLERRKITVAANKLMTVDFRWPAAN